ncbi:g2953 [Coccomyxa viridis]|uniref:G2953 protein n=1 Tax=Coccomyxa viridis TaxID=1274662 RepID=A0ABP1FS19_9CHLO
MDAPNKANTPEVIPAAPIEESGLESRREDVAQLRQEKEELTKKLINANMIKSFELKTAEGRARALMTELKDLREEKREAFQRAIALREEGLRVALAMSTDRADTAEKKLVLYDAKSKAASGEQFGAVLDKPGADLLLPPSTKRPATGHWIQLLYPGDVSGTTATKAPEREEEVEGLRRRVRELVDRLVDNVEKNHKMHRELRKSQERERRLLEDKHKEALQASKREDIPEIHEQSYYTQWAELQWAEWQADVHRERQDNLDTNVSLPPRTTRQSLLAHKAKEAAPCGDTATTPQMASPNEAMARHGICFLDGMRQILNSYGHITSLEVYPRLSAAVVSFSHTEEASKALTHLDGVWPEIYSCGAASQTQQPWP